MTPVSIIKREQKTQDYHTAGSQGENIAVLGIESLVRVKGNVLDQDTGNEQIAAIGIPDAVDDFTIGTDIAGHTGGCRAQYRHPVFDGSKYRHSGCLIGRIGSPGIPFIGDVDNEISACLYKPAYQIGKQILPADRRAEFGPLNPKQGVLLTADEAGFQ